MLTPSDLVQPVSSSLLQTKHSPFEIDGDIIAAVYNISAKIFYATYAILIISPPLPYRLQPCARNASQTYSQHKNFIYSD